MAGATLVTFGDAAGFDVLRQALTDEDQLEGSAPPVAIADFAAGSLAQRITGSDLPATKSDWAAWLTANAANLAFDATQSTWAVP